MRRIVVIAYALGSVGVPLIEFGSPSSRLSLHGRVYSIRLRPRRRSWKRCLIAHVCFHNDGATAGR